MLTNKNILLISPEPWDHIFVSKHHYAAHLANRGNRVFFLNPPTKTNKLMVTEVANVFQLNYSGFPRGMRFYPGVIRKKIILSVYRRLERMCNTTFDIIWSFDNSVFFDFSVFPSSKLTISHIVDYNQDFQTKMAATTADFCFCTTELIKQRLGRYNDHVYKIGHGYSAPLSDRPIGVKGGARRTRAIYAGNLSIPYIDWALFAEVVENNPDVDFVFIGPGADQPAANVRSRSDKKRVFRSANVFAMGRVASDALPHHYGTADILLVAYEEKYHRDQAANTHKMMEYLGSGKVIVATQTAEHVNRFPLIVMAGRNSEWPGLLKKVTGDLAFYNSPDLQRQRRVLAMQNSYDEQIIRIEKIIS